MAHLPLFLLLLYFTLFFLIIDDGGIVTETGNTLCGDRLIFLPGLLGTEGKVFLFLSSNRVSCLFCVLLCPLRRGHTLLIFHAVNYI